MSLVAVVGAGGTTVANGGRVQYAANSVMLCRLLGPVTNAVISATCPGSELDGALAAA
jgi:hypothetical protein